MMPLLRQLTLNQISLPAYGIVTLDCSGRLETRIEQRSETAVSNMKRLWQNSASELQRGCVGRDA